MKLFSWLILSVCSGILYRKGGTSKGTKWRDLGCPLIALLAIWLQANFIIPYWWAYLLTYGLMFASLTTYYDTIFGKDNFYAHGAGIGFACLPLMWVGISWYGIISRSIFLALSFGLLNKYVNKWQIKHSDDIEEYSRGALIILTTPILLI